MMKILVTGAGGFIGSNLVSRLSFATKDTEIVCMTRNAEKLKKKISNNNNNSNVKIVEANVMDYVQIKDALSEIDIAYYLIHSMEGVSAKEWKKFAEKDRKAAENFAKAATECKVKRIIYLGGLIHEEKAITNSKRGQSKISEHMQSRIEVGNILKTSSAKVTIFRAAVILGKDGASYKMLRYLVERLPVMVCPKWVLTNSQPISIDDVITYLMKSIEKEETEGREFDIGGPDTLRYIDMMRRYAKVINKK
ncbi:MAG: NAD(P)H-binding protein, partial [Nitrososphaeraceae archaeon]|nr:NAD(P)H-binding protein [Nitrososphaeraceae archaeon]